MICKRLPSYHCEAVYEKVSIGHEINKRRCGQRRLTCFILLFSMCTTCRDCKGWGGRNSVDSIVYSLGLLGPTETQSEARLVSAYMYYSFGIRFCLLITESIS